MNNREKYCNLDLIIFNKIEKFKTFYFIEKGYTEDDTYDKYSFLTILFNYYLINDIVEQNKILKLLNELYLKGNKPMEDLISLGFLERIYDNKNIYKKEIFIEYKGLKKGLENIKKFNEELKYDN